MPKFLLKFERLQLVPGYTTVEAQSLKEAESIGNSIARGESTQDIEWHQCDAAGRKGVFSGRGRGDGLTMTDKITETLLKIAAETGKAVRIENTIDPEYKGEPLYSVATNNQYAGLLGLRILIERLREEAPDAAAQAEAALVIERLALALIDIAEAEATDGESVRMRHTAREALGLHTEGDELSCGSQV